MIEFVVLFSKIKLSAWKRYSSVNFIENWVLRTFFHSYLISLYGQAIYNELINCFTFLISLYGHGIYNELMFMVTLIMFFLWSTGGVSSAGSSRSTRTSVGGAKNHHPSRPAVSGPSACHWGRHQERSVSASRAARSVGRFPNPVSRHLVSWLSPQSLPQGQEAHQEHYGRWGQHISWHF
jgi:hypothetical protein